MLIEEAGGKVLTTPLEGGSVDTWDRMYTMNLRSAVQASQQALPWLKASPSRAVSSCRFEGSMRREKSWRAPTSDIAPANRAMGRIICEIETCATATPPAMANRAIRRSSPVTVKRRVGGFMVE
ncbi:MAG: hypothetical protein HC788_08140 [Sphingopyxis sp.]|nr:hypothetical protein [Sphingopyxis sp.]